MRNLIAFFRRFQVFLLFILLQFLALSNYFTSFTYPRIQYLSSIGALNAKLWTIQNDVTKHFNLSKNNRYLQRENKWLREQLPQSCMQLGRGTVKIDDTLYAQQYSYLPAEVINSTFTRRNNYFTINVGKHQGISVGMGVISSRGIVGVIHAVSEHYSLVKTVLTENINIDVLIEKDGIFGLLKWNGENASVGTMTGVSNDLRIRKKRKVITRGGSGIFPRGLLVGWVRNVKQVEGKPVWDVMIQFSENYRTLQQVYVVKNLLLKEQKELEQRIPVEVQ
jgi:rod shape-determining protein MreC